MSGTVSGCRSHGPAIPRRQISLICPPYLTSAVGSVAVQLGGYVCAVALPAG
jgi:hypothetical protein